MQNQPLAGIAHYLTNLLPVGRLVAMALAVFAGRLRVLRTAFQPLEGIRQQILAIGTQFASGRLVFSATVDMHKLLQNVTILLPFIHYEIYRFRP